MQIFLGADHRGFQLKNELKSWLESQNHEIVDHGPALFDPEDDYNDAAKAVAKSILANANSFGLLICGSAQGVAMQANRFKGVRAAICYNSAEAAETRSHNDANVLCLSADTLDLDASAQIIQTFLTTTPLTDAKYLRRTQKLDQEN